ncbi:MAG: hypothetical protein HYV37_00990 [Candidatus Levyibacteriota bacterium]|nr:MAG: hypothetical protein HYV37_00990 [Candidatus Levybacteria bacterium]
MTALLTYSPTPGITGGELWEITKFLTVFGTGIKGVAKSLTAGKIDEDYLAIKTSAQIVNLSEKDAYRLIDKIRTELQESRKELNAGKGQILKSLRDLR